MRREDFQFYFNSKIPIKVFLKTGYKYSGKIKKLNKETFQVEDKTAGIVTIAYSDVSSPIKELNGRGRSK